MRGTGGLVRAEAQRRGGGGHDGFGRTPFVIASKAKQSSPTVATGLLRFARNDGVWDDACGSIFPLNQRWVEFHARWGWRVMGFGLTHRRQRAGAVGIGEAACGQAKFNHIVIGVFGVD